MYACMYVIYACMYTICVQHVKRGQMRVSDPMELELQKIRSHPYMGARNQTWVLWESKQCS